jgi:hypothetical protein
MLATATFESILFGAYLQGNSKGKEDKKKGNEFMLR